MLSHEIPFDAVVAMFCAYDVLGTAIVEFPPAQEIMSVISTAQIL